MQDISSKQRPQRFDVIILKKIKTTTFMKQQTWQINYQVFEKTKTLSKSDRLLLKHAKKALKHSWSPYSNFKVGAAVLLKNGEILEGSNQENAAYPMCLCAERTAFAAAASQFPKSAVTTIAITVKNPEMVIESPAAPCGACRQVICETELKHKQLIRVILRGETGPIYIFETGKDLLPFGFDASFL